MSQPHSFRFAAVVLTAMLSAASARAASNPDKPPLGNGKAGPVNLLGETMFECGTYAGNQAEHEWRRAIDARVQRDVRVGKRIVQGGLDYVYDDVWIIEDDGTLTFSGVNAFDNDNSTFRYTPTVPGVYSITKPPFSFDSALGNVIATGDDGAIEQSMQFGFPFAGVSWTEVFVSGNGIVSFGGPPNPTGYFDPADFYATRPKIAAYYLDLNELQNGSVWVKSEATKYTITWDKISEFGSPGGENTIQLVLYDFGGFTVTYNGIQTTLSGTPNPIVVGFHPGGAPDLEPISFTSDLPYTSGEDAAVFEEFYSFPFPLVNEVSLFRRFYQQFPDEFFQLVFFTNFLQTMSGFANELNIKNDVYGIGLQIFDSSVQYGSNGVLESRCNMNRLLAWMQSDPTNRWFSKGNNFLTIMGQESGHRWGAFTFFDAGFGPSNLILGRSNSHWSYYADMDHSSLEGGNWVNVGGNNWQCPTSVDYFSQLDEYLFGLRTPDEVKDFFYVSSAANNLEGSRSIGTPLINATAGGTQVPVTVEHIIAANGVREPFEENEQKDYRQGFILLLQAGTSPSQADLDKISGFRRAWEDYFEKSCDGRLTCNTSLSSNYPVAVVCGHVRHEITNEVVPDFTARSLQRGFNQHVPDGGRYTFRYQANASSGAAEPVTLVFEAANFDPDTLTLSVPYGTTQCQDIILHPTLTPVYITAFDAVARQGSVEVSWMVSSDEPVDRYELYRYDHEDAPARLLASGPFDALTRSYTDRTVLPASSYRYELVIVATDGDVFRSPMAAVTTPALATALAQNYPNPFNPKTTIEYTLGARADVSIGIYDAGGSLVVRLDEGAREPGTHRANWEGRDARGKPVGSGVYFYRLEGVKGIAPRKMVLLK